VDRADQRVVIDGDQGIEAELEHLIKRFGYLG